MSITTVSAREFARDLAHAKRATTRGPVFVTDRGKPTYALLKIEDYYKLTGDKPKSLLDVMNSLPGGDFEFEPPRLDSISAGSGRSVQPFVRVIYADGSSNAAANLIFLENESSG